MCEGRFALVTPARPYEILVGASLAVAIVQIAVAAVADGALLPHPCFGDHQWAVRGPEAGYYLCHLFFTCAKDPSTVDAWALEHLASAADQNRMLPGSSQTAPFGACRG